MKRTANHLPALTRLAQLSPTKSNICRYQCDIQTVSAREQYDPWRHTVYQSLQWQPTAWQLIWVDGSLQLKIPRKQAHRVRHITVTERGHTMPALMAVCKLVLYSTTVLATATFLATFLASSMGIANSIEATRRDKNSILSPMLVTSLRRSQN